ncbi:MAG: hypothetical protein LBB55_03710 [Zoogloeaceae bacterium]|jgi:hypothetical protein|nr:hypothetical protein [Zoogloeaceae bacterium]
MERPTSVSVIALILIATSSLSLYAYTANINDPMARDLMAQNPLPVSLQFAMVCAGLLAGVVSGIAMLKGRNWARTLYLFLGAIVFVIGMLTSPMKMALIPGAVFFVIVVFFLFRPAANAYFSKRNHAPQSMRTLAGILFRMIAGFFFYLVSVLAFISGLSTSEKLGILIGFSVPAVVALLVALVLTRFADWKRDTGSVLLGASGFSVFMIFSFACLFMDENFPKMMPAARFDYWTDYWTGCGVMAGLAALGWILVQADRGKTGRGAALDTLDALDEDSADAPDPS